MTGIEDEQISVVLRMHRQITQRFQNIYHPGRIIDVHLTSVCLYKDALHCILADHVYGEFLRYQAAALEVISGKHSLRTLEAGGMGSGCGRPKSAPAIPPATRAKQYPASALRDPQSVSRVGGWNWTTTSTVPSPINPQRWESKSIAPYHATNGRYARRIGMPSSRV